jgi:hypothetical protein
MQIESKFESLEKPHLLSSITIDLEVAYFAE